MTLHIWTAVALTSVIPDVEFHDLINVVAQSVNTPDYHHTVSVCATVHTVSLVAYVESIAEYLGGSAPIIYLNFNLLQVSGHKFTVYVHTNIENSHCDHYTFLMSLNQIPPHLDAEHSVLVTDKDGSFRVNYMPRLPREIVNTVYLGRITGYMIKCQDIKRYLVDPTVRPVCVPTNKEVDLAMIDVELMFGMNISPKVNTPYDPLNSLQSNMDQMHL